MKEEPEEETGEEEQEPVSEEIPEEEEPEAVPVERGRLRRSEVPPELGKHVRKLSEKEIPPKEVEIHERGLIFNPNTRVWTEGWQAVFRPAALSVAIDICAAGYNEILPIFPGRTVKIVSLFFTVASEVDVILCEDNLALSGLMDFGGSGQPNGIVIPFPYSPLSIERDKSFQIWLSDSVQVSGLVCYFYQ